MTDQDQDPPLLPLAEAAARTGRHPEALRAMARRGRLKAVRGNDGRLLVELPAGQGPGERPDETGQRPDLTGRVADLEWLLAELREELTAAKLAAGRAEAERDAAKDAAAVATAAKDELIAELKAMLADAHKPWWRRWRG